jgi:hypothetical protein
MEATGVYRKPVYYGLEDRFELWLCNAHHVKNVPGRKTDMSDANGSAMSWPRGWCARAIVCPLARSTRQSRSRRGREPSGNRPCRGGLDAW